MGRIKEFYHDEINSMDNEDVEMYINEESEFQDFYIDLFSKVFKPEDVKLISKENMLKRIEKL